MQKIFFPLLTLLLLVAAGCGRVRSTDELLNSSAAAAREGNVERAAELADKAVKQEPNRADALLLQAILLEKRGKFESAVAAAKRAAAAEPEDFVAQYTLGRLLAQDRKQLPEALVALGKALELRPGDRNTLILLVNVNMVLNPPQAQKYLFELARDRQLLASAEYQNQLGISLARRRLYKKAGEALQQACKTQPQNPVICFNLATFVDRYLKQGRLAVPFYKECIRLSDTGNNSEELRRLAEKRLQAMNTR